MLMRLTVGFRKNECKGAITRRQQLTIESELQDMQGCIKESKNTINTRERKCDMRFRAFSR